MSGGISLGVDIGGTFTDLVGFDHASRRITVAKARSTPRDLAAGILDCVRASSVSLADVATLFHGSTVVINAIIERKGARTGLVTTRGFRDVLEIGRGNRPANYDLFYNKPEPLVPRQLRFEVEERLAPDGSVVTPLSLADLAAVARAAQLHDLAALAICFLHAYANEAHEEQARAYLQDALPDTYICTSSDVAREWREFERTSTTVVNAFVGPVVESYVSRLEAAAASGGFGGRFYVMQSTGGVMSAARAKRHPVLMVESGPVAGMIGAAHVGALLDAPLVIGFDMGGTTAKASLIENGVPKVTQTYYVNGYAHGYPLLVPTIEVVEVGTGGGSLAWIDEVGALKVGPRSAGSEPGPVCFAMGGVEPTVTDANVMLGRINDRRYLGGAMALDLAGARRAIAEKIATPLALSETAAAAGIVTIANSNMALAVRRITIEKGVDPRQATMIAFGGGGPVHAAEVARAIGISRVVIPTLPSCFSALGMLLADLRHDLVRTHVCCFPAPGYDEINARLAQLESEGRQRLAASGLAPREIDFSAQLDLRYIGQQWTITTPLPDSLITQETARRVRAAFDTLYDMRFGHAFPALPTEIVNLRVVVVGRRTKPDFSKLIPRRSGGPASEMRAVHFEDHGFIDCPVFRRETLLWQDRIPGPALIEEDSSTTVIGPNDRADVSEHGFLMLHVEELKS